MKHIISIDDSTSIGKKLLGVLRTKKLNKAVKFLSKEEMEEYEDKVLGQLMEEGANDNYVDIEEVLKELRS